MTNVVHLPKSDEDKKFAEFWQIFPRKEGKMLAKAKWNAITNGGLNAKNKDRETGEIIDVGVLQATPEEIIEGAKRYRANNTDKNTYKLKDGGRFIMNPYTWLNRGGWLDI